jgi:hypothetical protein
MPLQLAETLRRHVDADLPHLRALTEEAASAPRGEGKWSSKQELGHLIDSASNNHIRFLLAAIGPEYRGPSYEQELWVRVHRYQELPWETLVNFWSQYNLLLAHVIEGIPEERLGAMCHIGSLPPATLGKVMEDYVTHMQHHLDQLLRREVVTRYP